MKAYNLTKLIITAKKYNKLVLSVVDLNFNMESQSGWIKHLLESLGPEWGYDLFAEGDYRCKIIYRKESWLHEVIKHQLKLCGFKKVFVSQEIWKTIKSNKYEWWVFLPYGGRVEVCPSLKLSGKDLKFE